MTEINSQQTGLEMTDVQMQSVTCSADGVEMQGCLAWDQGQQGRRPGVLVAHESWCCTGSVTQ